MANSIKMLKYVYCVAYTDTESETVKTISPYSDRVTAVAELQKVYKELKESLVASGEKITRSHAEHGAYIIKTKSLKIFWGNVVKIDLTNAGPAGP